VSDWLRLRAAALTVDSAERASAYAMLRTDVARSRISWTEAAAREYSGDVVGAARTYETLGAPVAALRLRLAAARDDPTRGAIRKELLALIQSRSGSRVAREATTVLDNAFVPLTAAEHLAVARSAAIAGPALRAASGFAAAFRQGLGTHRDRYTYGKVLSGLRRDREAAAQFARVTTPRALAASAAYQHARSLLRSGAETEARAALDAVSRTYAADTGAASSALFVLGDLAADNGRDDLARAAFLDVGHRYPTSQFAPRALFRAALIAFVADSARSAADELDAVRSRYPRDVEAAAALYWAGRAWERVGNAERARARWNEVIARDPLSYYATLSARRLDGAANPVSRVASLGDSVPSDPAVDSAMGRATLLERLDMTAEARYEHDWLQQHAGTSPVRLLATASAFAQHGMAARAITLARQATANGVKRDATIYRLIYPLAYEDALVAEADRHGLDPAFVAALIRQESQFTPWATSVAGARGLMQIMPEVGRQIATARAFPLWNPALLYRPDVSLELGTVHLAGLQRDYARPEHVLAAYNAGRSRVARWMSKPGTGDPEVFVERIPFRETRDYVRIVLRNRAIYQVLYPRLQGPRPSPRDTTAQ
jgi:soluble lytic murein transglycosylase